MICFIERTSGFWNCIKRSRPNRKVKSNSSPTDIAKHFETIMKASNDLSDEQTLIMEHVEYWSTLQSEYVRRGGLSHVYPRIGDQI